MIEMKATHRAPIKLGHTGENEAVRVAFSLLPFKETFPDGVPSLLARRKGDASAYPVPLTIEADTAYWAVTRADTEKAGFGQCELQWLVGNALAKSDKFDFFVVKALEAGAEAPDAPSKAWFEAIQAQIGDLSKLTTKEKENLVAAINEAARTGGGSGGGTIEMRVSGGYIQYSNDGVTWENLIAVSDLKGDKGETGPKGEQGPKGDAGPQGDVGPKGDSYTLTTADKAEIAETVVAGGVQAELGDEPVSLGITGAQVGQIAKITAVDTQGKPTAWEPVEMASGGDGTKAWTKIIDADVTETTSSFRAEGLANVTEFDILWSNLQNITTTKSGLNAVINNIQVAGSSSTAIVGSSGSSLYGWTRLTYDGLFWHVQRSAGAIVADNIAAASIIYATYNLVRGVGAATSFALNAPTMYAPVSGKLEVWAR